VGKPLQAEAIVIHGLAQDLGIQPIDAHMYRFVEIQHESVKTLTKTSLKKIKDDRKM
jgi:hypothetical protein